MQKLDKMEEGKKDKIVKKGFFLSFLFLLKNCIFFIFLVGRGCKKKLIKTDEDRLWIKKWGQSFRRSRLAKRTVSPNFPSKENSFEAGLTKTPMVIFDYHYCHKFNSCDFIGNCN